MDRPLKILNWRLEIPGDGNETAHKEGNKYMTSVEDKKLKTLDWWKRNASRYPRISVVARKMLARTATSLPSERLFAFGGKIVSHHRACLDPETKDQLLFLNSYVKVRVGLFAVEAHEDNTARNEPEMAVKVKVKPGTPPLPSMDVDTKWKQSRYSMYI